MNEAAASWLNTRFLEWEKEQGKRQTISAFAKFLGVPQPSLSNWMAGVHEPSGDSLFKIATKLGREIYDLLGIENPPITDPILAEIASKWDYLSEEERISILKMDNKKNKPK